MGIKDSNQLLISKGCNIVTLHGNMAANQDSSDKKIIKCFVDICPGICQGGNGKEMIKIIIVYSDIERK